MVWPQWALGGVVAGTLILAGTLSDPGSAFAPSASRVAAAAFNGPVSADVTRIIDGDTFEAEALIWLGERITVRVRIAHIDAPELHAPCAAERAQARAARAYLIRRIAGKRIRLSSVRYDKYGGRVDADVRDRLGDVGHALIAAGHARPYDGRRRAPWCEAV